MKLVSQTLVALYRILQHGEQLVKSIGENPYVTRIVQSNAAYLLEELQHHKDGEIYTLVSEMLDKFFNTDFI